MPFSLIPFLLLIVPIAEIAMFILLGDVIGLWWTLGLIFVTAAIGSVLLRIQGFGILARIRADMGANRVPARELVHGVMIMVAGVLLLTPGFITDSLGFALFVPPIRDGLWRVLKSRIHVVGGAASARAGQHHHSRPDDAGTIDLDADDYVSEPDASSPWNRDANR